MSSAPYNYPVRVELCKCGCGREVVIRSRYHTGYHKVCLLRIANQLHRAKELSGSNKVATGGKCAICPRESECRALLGETRVWGGHLQVRALLCQPRKWTDLAAVGVQP